MDSWPCFRRRLVLLVSVYVQFRTSSEAKQDFGYWMDHRISYEIKIDDESVMLKFGLEEDPIAVARVSCVLYVYSSAKRENITSIYIH